MISIVSPVYMAENIVSKLVSHITEAVSGMGVDYEIVLDPEDFLDLCAGSHKGILML